MGDVADSSLCPGGSRIGCVLFWLGRWSWTDPQSARDRGLLQLLQLDFLTMVATVLVVAAALSVFMRLRRAKRVERQQIKWFAYAAAAAVMGLVLAEVIPDMIEVPLWFERIGNAIFLLLLPAMPISMGIAILRYRLYDIDIIINRTLVYGALYGLTGGGVLRRGGHDIFPLPRPHRPGSSNPNSPSSSPPWRSPPCSTP